MVIGDWKTECGYLYGWIKKAVTYTKISPKLVNPRDLAGIAEEEEWRCTTGTLCGMTNMELGEYVMSESVVAHPQSHNHHLVFSREEVVCILSVVTGCC